MSARPVHVVLILIKAIAPYKKEVAGPTKPVTPGMNICEQSREIVYKQVV